MKREHTTAIRNALAFWVDNEGKRYNGQICISIEAIRKNLKKEIENDHVISDMAINYIMTRKLGWNKVRLRGRNGKKTYYYQ